SSRRRHTRCLSDWSSDVCSSDLHREGLAHYFGRLIVAVKRHQRLGQLKSQRRETCLSLRSDQRRQRISEFAFNRVGFSFSDKRRSEERRVGKECRSGWSGYHWKE